MPKATLKPGGGRVSTPVNAPRPTVSRDLKSVTYAGNARSGGAQQAANQIANATGRQTEMQNDLERAAIMQQSGSTDPTDPYNWKGIASFLTSQNDANTSTGRSYAGTGGSYEGSSQLSAPAPIVNQAPSSFTASPAAQAPSQINNIASGAPGAPSGQSFEASGMGPFSAGQFERRRNARTPRQGLSVTPELLRRAAQARLGSF